MASLGEQRLQKLHSKFMEKFVETLRGNMVPERYTYRWIVESADRELCSTTRISGRNWWRHRWRRRCRRVTIVDGLPGTLTEILWAENLQRTNSEVAEIS